MNHFNSSAQSKWGLTWSVLALIAMGYTGQAQAQNASTVTLTGSVTLTTCFVKIATGSGAAGGGTGNTAHAFTIPTVQNNVTTTNATRGGALGAVTKFTVGLASTSGGSSTCAIPGTWNTAFSTAGTVDNSINGRAFLPVTGGAAGFGLELSSYDAAGSTLVRAIGSYPASGLGVTYAGANNTSAQTGLDAVAMTATQTFGVGMVKNVAAGTAITSGSLSASVTVSYAVF